MFEKLILKIKNKIWFIPGIYSFIALILSIIAIIIDTTFSSTFKEFIPSFLLTSVDLAKTILSTLAASLITMITITFSTIMVVLTTYSSQYSPRTLQDFLNEKTTLRVLGVFMGSFIYFVVSLLFMREAYQDQLVFSAFLAVVISIVCLAFFVFFIHHVSTSIQVNKLIHKISLESIHLIDSLNNRIKSNDSITSSPKQYIENSDIIIELFSDKSGYIQLIDTSALVIKAEELNISIKMEKKVGEFVLEGTKLMTIYSDNSINSTKEILKYITIGRYRSMIQDIEFGIQKIVDVALRAISPGINDPNTAIHCIKRLSLILSSISLTDIHIGYYHDKEDILRLRMKYPDFDDLLYQGFHQIRFYSNGDASVLSAIIDSLILISENNLNVSGKIWDFANYIIGGFDDSKLQPMDKSYINSKIKRLADLTDKNQNTLIFK